MDSHFLDRWTNTKLLSQISTYFSIVKVTLLRFLTLAMTQCSRGLCRTLDNPFWNIVLSYTSTSAGVTNAKFTEYWYVAIAWRYVQIMVLFSGFQHCPTVHCNIYNLHKASSLGKTHYFISLKILVQLPNVHLILLCRTGIFFCGLPAWHTERKEVVKELIVSS